MQTMLDKTESGTRLSDDAIGRLLDAGGQVWFRPNSNEERICFRNAVSVAELIYHEFSGCRRRNFPVRLNGVFLSGPLAREVFGWKLWVDANTGEVHLKGRVERRRIRAAFMRSINALIQGDA